MFARTASVSDAALYAWTDDATTVAWCGYVLPYGAKAVDSLTAAQAWNDYWGSPVDNVNGGCYVFAVAAPTSPASLLDRLLAYLAALDRRTNGYAYRYLLWVGDQDGTGTPRAQQVSFARSGSGAAVASDSELSWRNIRLAVPAGVTVKHDDAVPSVSLLPFATGATPSFRNTIGTLGTFGTVSSPVTVAIAGDAAARVDTTLDVAVGPSLGGNDLRRMRAGVQWFHRDGDRVVGRLHPDLDSSAAQKARFAVRADPLRPLDAERTAFVFTTRDGQPPAFDSGFVTDSGRAVRLTPAAGRAGYVLSDELYPVEFLDPPDPQTPTYYFTPFGPFAMTTAAPAPPALMCGLSAVETLSFANGDALTFHPGRAACAVRFPLPPVDLAKPGKPPVSEELLDPTYTTAWATVTPGVAAGAPSVYFSQAADAPLFGSPPAAAGEADPPRLAHRPTPLVTPAAPFPLGPDAASPPAHDADAAEVAQFERTIVAPSRFRAIVASRAPDATLPAASAGTGPMTTPSGLLVTPGDTPTAPWKKVLLARNTGATTYELAFRDVDNVLRDALLTNQQFLVVTRPRLPWNAGGTVFDDVMEIEGWPMRVAVEPTVTPGTYRNVLVFKFRPGKLSDLVRNPSGWTAAADFNETANEGLALVSQWLIDYIAEARALAEADRATGGDFFQHFLDVVDSETWNGILALRVDVDAGAFPPELKGLLAGIDPSALSAHHLGIEVAFVRAGTAGPYVDGDSSMFGLVHYVDPAYRAQLALGADPDRPVPATPGPYDFKVLTLKALFENTALKAFRSRLQLTVDDWFGDRPVAIADGTGAILDVPSHSVLLDGAYQRHDGDPTFTFASASDRMFLLPGNVLGAVETTGASFATLADRADGIVRSRFTLSGYLNFQPAKGLDAFSFGSDWTDGVPRSREGLAFGNLYVDLSFPLATPAQRTFALDAGETTFDALRSRARPGSLFPRFPLQVDSLVTGTGKETPQDAGYLGVTLPKEAPFAGVGTPWYGLSFRLDLGTAGALANDAGLTAYLLTAWSPGSGGSGGTYAATVGLRLPGTSGSAKLLSLQGVLRLAVGGVELLLGETGDGRPAYLLKLSRIALKLLGVSFPTSGNTTFYLFGDPANGAPQDSLGWYAAYVKTPAAVR